MAPVRPLMNRHVGNVAAEKPRLPVDAVPGISQGDQHVTQMQLVQHQSVPYGLAQYPRVDVARVASLNSRHFADCRPDQRVRTAIGERYGPSRSFTIRRFPHRKWTKEAVVLIGSTV